MVKKKGMCEITFQKKTDAMRAIKEYNGVLLDGLFSESLESSLRAFIPTTHCTLNADVPMKVQLVKPKSETSFTVTI